MKRRVLVCLLLMLSVISAACTSSGDDAQDGAVDGEWVLEMLTIDNDTAIPLPEQPVGLRIDGDQIGGSAGCNSLGGSASFDGDGSVQMGDIAWTLMACADVSLMEFEQQYTRALTSVTEWSIDADKLRLQSASVGAVYTVRIAPPDLALVDTVWTLDTFFDGPTVTHSAGMDDVTVRFSEAGVQVAGRCWTIPGFATVEPGGEGSLSTDFSSADPDFSCRDRAFFEDMVDRLSEATEYRIDESRLTISANGNDLVSLRG